MDKKNLQFFDKNGFNLNFDWNPMLQYWEGTIYLPKISVGLYASTPIYILEKLQDSNIEFSFPTGVEGDKITFHWDKSNKFVDEFFMFNFDDTYIIKDTSALVYTPNDGPDCKTLLINQFDEYDINLRPEPSSKALPVYIAFMAKEKFDANTYNRTLIMKYNGSTVAKIKFYAETVEEDERLKIWNSNLGYNITPEDTMIFYKSDIKEYKPDYQLLNEKRKELMMEGPNIYPYIGSYKAIINALKFFGYENLSIIEYWKNINPQDENFGKIYHSSKYSLTNKETLTIGAKNIKLPNKDYKKINQLALVYTINDVKWENGKVVVDEWELPLVEEKFTYTIEEALIKLFALRKKLNKEFMPGTSRIVDIIGEGNYFGIQGLKKINSSYNINITSHQIKPDFTIFPKKNIHITDDRYFNNYILEKLGESKYYPTGNKLSSYNLISDIQDITISNFDEDELEDTNFNLTEDEKCELYKNFYNEVYVDHTRIIDDENKDESFSPCSAKLFLTSNTFEPITFENSGIDFKYIPSNIIRTYDNEGNIYNLPDGSDGDSDIDSYCIIENNTPLTFGNAESYRYNDTPFWEIKMSRRFEPEVLEDSGSDLDDYYSQEIIDMLGQEDDELKNVGIKKSYFDGLTSGEIQHRLSQVWSAYGNNVFIKLPYTGYYDVTLTINGEKHTKKKYIKVEPYEVEVKGFYYDARELPENIRYSIKKGSEMYEFILKKLQDMTYQAIPEHIVNDNIDLTMPTYSVSGEIINRGPYTYENIKEEWYLMDNINYNMSLLLPDVETSRYIRNGVDVKPYTWFLLGYEYSKIVGKKNPKWTLINNITGKSIEYYGKYLTFLLKEEGNYTVRLDIDDNNGNKYFTSRNIIVVANDANYKIYQTFKKEYDEYIEEKELKQLKAFEMFVDINPFIEDLT